MGAGLSVTGTWISDLKQFIHAAHFHSHKMVVAKKYVLKSHFQGLPKREDLEIVEEELPPLKDGGRALDR